MLRRPRHEAQLRPFSPLLAALDQRPTIPHDFASNKKRGQLAAPSFYELLITALLLPSYF
jgi:hypothetical protein